MSGTPAFWQFAGAYLHQDWPEVHGSAQQALDAFIEGEFQLASRLPDEIESILRQYPSEDALREYVVESQGACYAPGADAGGYRGWLTSIAERVRTATATE